MPFASIGSKTLKVIPEAIAVGSAIIRSTPTALQLDSHLAAMFTAEPIAV